MLRIVKHQAEDIHGDWDIVHRLLDNFDDDINVVDKNGSSIIGYASMREEWGIVDRILEYFHVNVDGRDKEGNTVFMNAVKSCDVSVVREILEKNPNINAVNKVGCTALHLAAWNGNFEILNILVSQSDINCNILNKNGDTALDVATTFGMKSVIDFLTVE